MGGGEGLNQGPSEVLQSSSAHPEATTSLNASWLALFPAVIIASAKSKIGCHSSCPELWLSQTHTCPPPLPVPCAGGCPPAPWGEILCDPVGTDLVSNTSAGSPDLHFFPFEGPQLGKGRAETLNRFVLICFMILLGAVFTQIWQASGLDNLLEISGV